MKRSLDYFYFLQFRQLLLWFTVMLFGTLAAHAQSIEVTSVETLPSRTTVLTGEDYVYSIKYTCTGITGNCNGQKICAVLPPEIAFNVLLFGDALTASTNYDDATRTACWTMGNLGTGTTGQLSLSCRFRENFTPNGTTAALTVGTVTAATVTATTDPKLVVEKNGPSSVGVDGTVTYFLSIANRTNNGSNRGGVFQDNVTFTDTWPAGGTYVSHTQNTSFAAPTINSNSITFSPGTMSSGDGTGFSVTIKYPAGTFPIGTDIVNTATGTGTPRGSGQITSNTASVTTQVQTARCDVRVGFRGDQTSTNITAGANMFSQYGWGNRVQVEAGNSSNVPADIDVIHDIPLAFYPVKFTANNNSTGGLNFFYKTNLNNSSWIPSTQNPINTPFGGTNIELSSLNLASNEYVTQIRMTNAGSMPAGGSYSIGYGFDFTGTDRNGAAATPASVSLRLKHAETCDQGGLGSGYSYITPADLVVNIVPPYTQLGVEKYVNPGAVPPGGEVTYRLRWDLNETGSSSPPVNPIITDLLPTGIEYVAGSARQDGGGPLPAGTIEEVIPNYNNTGRILVRWKFIGIYGQNANDGKDAVVFKAKVKAGTPVGTQNNDWGVSSSDIAGSSTFTWPGNSDKEKPDVNDVNGVNGTTDIIITSTPVVLNVITLAALESYKWVKGSLDAAETRYPDNGKTIQGGTANYRLVVRNLGNVPMSSIKVVDILPFVGDKAVIGTQDRLSAWRPFLTSAVTFLPNNQNIQVFYSLSQNPCRPEVYNSPGCTNDWTTTPPADLATVQALKFDFGSLVMNGADSLQLSWQMKAPVDAPTGGEIAWNSFAFSATRQDNMSVLAPSEPVKVGISANQDTKASLGDFVWVDINKDGLQTGESGINNVTVYLLNSSGTTVDSTITSDKAGQPGYYLFGNLDAGTYSVKFALPAGYQFTTKTVSTGDGSDADPMTGTTTPITLVPSEKNLTLDAGIYLKPTCVKPKRFVQVTDPTCFTSGKIEIVSVTNGDRYGLQNGTTYTAPLYADATAIPGTLPATIKNNINNTADSVYTIRVFNGLDACFTDTTVTVKAAPVKPTIAQQSGSPFCRSAGTTYTIKFTATGGTVMTVPSFAVVGDSVANIPIATASVKLLVTSAGGCKDSITVTAPNCIIPCNAPKPTATGAAICGSGTVALKSSGCTTGFTAKWFTDEAGTIAAAGTNSGDSYTTPSITATTDYYVLCQEDLVAICKSATTKATAIINPKPNAGADQAVCAGTTTTLTATATAGTWTAQAGNPLGANLGATTGGVATVSFIDLASGNFRFIYTVDTCTDTMTVKVNPKSNISAVNPEPVCSPATIDLSKVPISDTEGITPATGYPKFYTTAADAGTNTNALTNLIVSTGGTYWIRIQSPEGCFDTTTVKVVINPKPTVVQQSGSPFCRNAGSKYTIKFTATGGTVTTVPTFAVTGDSIANIPIATASVRLIVTSAGGCKDSITVEAPICDKPVGSIGDKVFADTNKDGKQDTGEAGVDGVTVNLLNSMGAVITTTTTAGGGLYKFPNLLAGTYSVEFVKSSIPLIYSGFTAKDSTATGTTDDNDSDADKVTGKTGSYTIDTTKPAGNPTRDVTSADAGLIQKPDVNCVLTPPTSAVGPNVFACKTKPYPTLQAMLIGTGTVDWYKTATAGTAVATGTLSYTPMGNVAANDTFYLAGRSTLPSSANCPVITERTRVVVVAQTCADTVDLALKKLISKKLAKIGDELIYTIKVWNQSKTNATGVEVVDSLNTGVQYVSSAATRGSYDIATKKWSIGPVAANGDTVVLTIEVKVLAEGVWFNTAQISSTNQKDKDSTPGNNNQIEDDIDYQCFSVPFKLCTGQSVMASVPSNYTGVVWKDAQGNVVPSSNGQVTLTKAGTYTFTATNGTCPAEGCCPVIVEEINCCPADLCIPFTVKKVKKK